MVAEDVKLIEYSKKVEWSNTLTHGVGAVLSLVAVAAMLIKAQGARSLVSAAVYGVSLLAVYVASTVYHGLKMGEAKRIARLVDHSMIPVLIAGTATPCALVTLFDVSMPHGVAVFSVAWGCAAFGLISKLFFFEKLKSVTVTVYIVSCLVMICSAVPLLDEINKNAFYGLLAGNLIYLAGAAFCGLGIKRPALHVVFHLFVVAASAVHFAVIFLYVI